MTVHCPLCGKPMGMFLCPDCEEEAAASIRLELWREECRLDFTNLPDPPKQAKPLLRKSKTYRDPFDGREMTIE